MVSNTQKCAEWVKRRINVARAEQNLSWQDIAARLSTKGHPVSPGSLMSKHSRGSFTAVEFIALLRVLKVETIEVPQKWDLPEN